MDRFEETKLRIKEATDLEVLVQSYVPLRRRGRYFVGLCPFHEEKTPSFTVFPDTQHFKCFGCGKAGDVFSFLMERDGLDFRAAMELLGERAGVDVRGVFGRPRPGERSRVEIGEVLGTVAKWFVEVLHGAEGVAARDYLKSRGLDAAIDGFGIGAHPAASGRLRDFARRRDLPPQVLQQAGLLGSDGRREPFAGRVIFPIVDEGGRCVGFGGRVLPDPRQRGDDRRPKYLNSPDSPLFNKRKLLFGLRHVKQSGERRLVVVEGYTDVIACHLAGFTGAAATLGTALTSGHARLLERYATAGVVLLFDGDRAGRQAADRAFRELVHTTLPVRIALLPEGRDPADLAAVGPTVAEDEATASRAELAGLLDGADDALTMWFRLMRQRLDLTLDVNVQRASAECGQILQAIESTIRRQALTRDMASHLGVTESALQAMIRRLPARRPTATTTTVEPAGPDLSDPLAQSDLDLVACLLADVSVLKQIRDDEHYHAGFVGEIVAGLREAAAGGRAGLGELASFAFSRASEQSDSQQFLAEAVNRAEQMRDVRGIFEMLIRGRQVHFAKQKARQARLRAQQALADGDQALADRLTREFLEQARQSGAPPPSGRSEPASGIPGETDET